MAAQKIHGIKKGEEALVYRNMERRNEYLLKGRQLSRAKKKKGRKVRSTNQCYNAEESIQSIAVPGKGFDPVATL